MLNILTLVYLFVAVILVGLVLMQQGKGADVGASVFGSAGSANFLSRMTAVFATIFFGISLLIGNLNTHQTRPSSQFEDLSNVQQTIEQPAKVNSQLNSDIPQ